MADISKDQLKKEIAAILKNADLTKISAKKVRNSLEEKLDADLSDQKKQIDEFVMDYVNNQQKKGKKKDESDDDEDEDEENGADEDDDSEEDKKKKKPAPKRAAPKKKKASSGSDDDASGDENVSDDEYSPKKKAKPAPKKGKKKKGSDSDSDEDWAKAKKKRGGGGGQQKGYTKPLTLSKDLAKLMGQDTMARHEVVKKVWAIIKERNLYDPKNKQFAICDDELYKVIGEKRFRIFGMMKYLKDQFS